MADTSSQSSVFDVGRQQVGAVYGKALLGAAQQQGIAEQVLSELDALCGELLVKIPQLESTLASPRISYQEKERILDSAFRQHVSLTLLNGLKVVARHGRLDCLREIASQYRSQYNTALNRTEVDITTAAPIDAQQIAALSTSLRDLLGSEVDVQPHVDPDLIGGMVVRVGDTVFDGSVTGRLDRLRRQTLANASARFRQDSDQFTTEG